MFVPCLKLVDKFVMIINRPYDTFMMLKGFELLSRQENLISRETMFSDQQALLDAVNQIMPFGKYAGRPLLKLPEPYLVWFKSKGFPEGKLGQQLELIYEIKLNGLEGMLEPLLRSSRLGIRQH
jgi:uncharacterized protein (DUF3820 family)